MIGPKKLSTIRQELRQALASTGQDPIRWLEERMAAPAPQGVAEASHAEVLLSLRRVLEGNGKKRRRRTRASSGK